MNDIEQFQMEIDKYARQYNVASYVHEKDFIFQFVFNHPGFKTNKERAVEYYFSDGNRSCLKLLEISNKFLKKEKENDKVSLLEFASGYGCVSRHLAQHTQFEITASDIHSEANKMIKEEIGLQTLQSCSTPEAYSSSETYDLIFCLSFFSHMPDDAWGRWLKSLFKLLRDDGIIVFTTHGLESMLKFAPISEIDESGFWFRRSSEQHDLNSSEYGLTVTTPTYVLSKIDKLSQAEILYFEQASWWGHQDTYVVRKVNRQSSD